ncbi:chromosome segregation protein [Arboricoccus pini]|uniref:Chromosome partition protein Smc n=1 Tax=Arboricoccus pini TaxID=1963835 RepID=A0A212RDR8_9PROT|nr:AAA family ATPase [Arboricoccus pini]SNB70440.1 chromosome segregation protein [Arboricoccus pini]
MDVRHLRISGFKSFSDPVDLAIEPGLTGIVGPNGCGKSNVVDALRWVMGESSARGLRGSGMDDVIFNGSAFRPAFDFAEVALKLQGPIASLTGFEQIEDIEIVRRIGRGVGSSYRLNGREIRARDVQMLFADASAGARSAAIVGQGQIGLIVEARPDERRRLLEDAAGIGGLHARRREAELRLATTEANLGRLADLLTTRRQRLGELERQASQALRYRRLSARLRALERRLAEVRLTDLVATIQRLQGQAYGLRVELAEATRAATEARSARDQAQRRQALARDRLTAATALAAQLGERAAAQMAALAAAAADREALRQELAAAEAEARAEGQSVPEIDARRNAAVELLLDLRRALKQVSLARAADEDELPRLATRRDEAEAALAEARQRLAGAEAAFKTAGLDCQRLHDATAGLKAALEALPAELDATPLDRLRDEIAAFRQALESGGARRQSLAAAVAAAEASLPGLRQAQAEAALAAGEAREAALRHEAKRGEAVARHEATVARRQGLERDLARLEQRRVALEQRLEAVDRQLAGFDLPAAAEVFALARARRATAEAERARLAREREEAERDMEVRQRAASDAAAQLARLEAERASLEALVPEMPGQPMIDRLVLDEGLGAALAAALGDDLLADADGQAPTHWRSLPASMEMGPSLPTEAVAMDGLVSGGAALQARLCQVGLIERSRGPALQERLRQGQRLVSREGDLWRWDGFVRLASSGEAAARLTQRRRLAAVRREIEPKAAARAATAADVQSMAVTLGQLREAADAADKEAREAERVETQAGHEEEKCRAAAAAAMAEQQRLRRDLATLLEESQEPARDLAALQAAGLGEDETRRLAEEGEVLEGRATALREAAATAHQAVVEQEAVWRRLQRELEDQDRLLAMDRSGLEAAALKEAGQAAELAANSAALRAERQRLEAELAAADEAGRSAARLLESAGAARAAALAEVEALGAAALAASEAHAACRTRLEVVLRGLARDEERARALEQEEARLCQDIEAARRRAQAAAARVEGLSLRLVALGPEAMGEPPIQAEHRAAEAEVTAVGAEVAAIERDLAEAERQQRASETLIAERRERLAILEAELARESGRREAAESQRAEALAAAQPSDEDQLEGDDAEQGEAELARRLDRLRTSRDRLGAVNLRAAVELEEMQAALEGSEREVAEVEGAVDRLRRAITTLNGEARARLLKAFGTVEGHFQRLFHQLFGGGKASLRLTNLDDPLNAGLELDAMPPGKRLTHVSLLSGGEKSMTGLALVFAFFLATPSPLCVLDEVDAPLDDANVDRFVLLTEAIAKETGTRFLCVTHHPLTMARMHRLYGVTMVERGVSRLVSVALDEAVELRQSAA